MILGLCVESRGKSFDCDEDFDIMGESGERNPRVALNSRLELMALVSDITESLRSMEVLRLIEFLQSDDALSP